VKHSDSTFPAHAIAIVGMGGRFPGARTLADFWHNMRDGVESLESFSDADLEAAGVDARLAAAAGYVRKGTALAGADLFDAEFFGFSPREAQILDPQQRIFLECAWEALEHAGYVADASQRATAVYAGSGMNTYLLTQILRDPALMAAAGGYQLMLASDKDFLCTRVSYKLDLRGPSVTVQTACSTSLVAVVMACRALARGECDLALAGGVAVSFPQRAGYLYEEGMILSPDGRCRPFDVGASGTRGGAGCGIVVLKRLSEAMADRDTIHAVIRGAAVNNDGSAKAGYTAPSVDGQVEVIATAQAMAGVTPADISYIEAHGTATPLGDPIEIAALTQVFRASTAQRGFCRLGSLKANLGHLDAAAGVAGLIKTVLALQHAQLPPLVNFSAPNPQLELESGPFVASASGGVWEESDIPRRAGVSSFGIGGTNAHVVLEEAPATADRAAPRAPHLLLLSAKTPTALQQMTSDLLQHLAAAESRLDDVAWTLQAGRRAFAQRRAVVVVDRAQALDVLARPNEAPVLTGYHDGAPRSVAFLFSGQGSQYLGMGACLYSAERSYREAVDRCAVLLTPQLGLDLRDVLFADASDALIQETRLAQPALFVTEYALAQLWASWGVKPAAMLGHSIGEYVAAHLSGVMSLEDALSVIALRGKLMQGMPAGAMAAVHLSEASLRSQLSDGVEIAAVNAPTLCTIAGPAAVVAKLTERLQASGVETRLLHTSHAFHSQMMQPVLAPLVEHLQRIELKPPTIPYLSNLTGTWITPAQAMSPAYYGEHLRRTVKFEAGVRALALDAAHCLLEIGPGNALTTMARMTLAKNEQARTFHSMARAGDERGDAVVMREAAAKLWLAGVQLDFEGMQAGVRSSRIPLPTYPFERKRYWVDGTTPTQVLPGAKRLEDWFYAPAWTRDDSGTDARVLTGNWLVLGDDDPLTKDVLAALRAAGAAPILVQRGQVLQRLDAAHFTVRAGSAEDMAAVSKAILPEGAIHLWSIGRDALSARGAYDALVALGVGLAPGIAGAPVRVIHASTRVENVLDEVGQLPQSALALGPVLVLPTEHPNLRLRCVDLEACDAALVTRAAVPALLAEAAISRGACQSAWRHGRRWVKKFERVVLPPLGDSRLPFKEGGVYLITGGSGGIGLSLARWLGREFKARLLLTFRSTLPPRDSWDALLATRAAEEPLVAAIAAIRAIEAEGAEVIAVAADATDEEAMAGAISAARRRWNALDGVIHAAGNPGPGTLAALSSEEETDHVLAAKVTGLEVLARLLANTALDVVVLMSSINAILGAPGACGYSAANAVLDAFADGSSHPPMWRQVVAINWGAWRDVGMAANLSVRASRQAEWRAFVAAGIPPRMGIEALARALISGRRRVVVTAHEWLKELHERESGTPVKAAAPRGLKSDGDPLIGLEESHVDESLSDLERRLAAIWGQVLGIDRIGLHDDFFELGGHSLLGTRVLAYVQESFGIKLELREVFDSPTIHLMAQRIEASLGQQPAATGAVMADDSREELEF
jgi:phthiocerol/phenolphthiocerol synthesis type-I polyketide synthase E